MVSEAGVPASPLIQNGRLYAEISADGLLNTGIAVANPNDADAIITFEVRNTAGTIVKEGNFTLKANRQRAAFLDGDPFLAPSQVQGTLNLSSNVPVSVVALRSFYNERVPAEFLMTTLPVVDTSLPAGAGTQYIPHFADGAGFTTHILLVNPTDNAMIGTVQFFDQGLGSSTPGVQTNVNIGGHVSNSFEYSVAARSSRKLSTTGTAAGLTQGSVRVTRITAGGSAPVSLVVFTYKPAGITLSEAGVPATQGNLFHMYVEASGTLGTAGSIETGFAIANTSTASGTVTLQVTNLNGETTSLPPASVQTLLASGQIVGFLSSFFPALQKPFRGILRISTSTSGISVVGIRSRYNENASYLMTTTPSEQRDARRIVDGDAVPAHCERRRLHD